MPRFIYRWEPTQYGNRLVRRLSAKTDYPSLKKDELIDAAKAAGKDSSGTKAEIIERLTDGD